MKFNTQFFTTSTGQLALVALLAVAAIGFVAWQRAQHRPLLTPAAKAPVPVALPKVFTRDIPRVTTPAPVPATFPASSTEKKPTPTNSPTIAPAPARVLPVSLFSSPPAAEFGEKSSAPYGRMIPCETVLTLESSRIDTPVVGLVTADVWHQGRLIIPAGAEVHGHAALDRERERIAVNGRWVIVWPSAKTGVAHELRVEGLALDREFDSETRTWSDHDGSAGLRGAVLRNDDWRELKLFAATFLSTATAALEQTRASSGILGEVAVPAATARNASLAGTSSVLREYAQQLREAIARDGFYLRVPAGKPFYLYVTESINDGNAPATAASPLSHAK